jgi:putative FmdB family regulatory protein
MSIMNYRCLACGKEFAKIILNLDNAPRSCPVCQAADPVEVGPAFRQDASSLERVMCSSCDVCGDSSCDAAASS